MTESSAVPAVSVHLEAADEARLARLTNELVDQAGPQPGRPPSREDVLRALLVVAERNAGVRSAVRTEVRIDGVRRDPSGEVTAVAETLRDLATHLGDAEARDAEEQAVELEDVAAAVSDDRSGASERLHRVASAVERLGSGQGSEVLRAVLAAAERLEIVRDALDPAAKTRCSVCHRPVRALAGGRPEAHLDRTRTPCGAGPRPAPGPGDAGG